MYSPPGVETRSDAARGRARAVARTARAALITGDGGRYIRVGCRLYWLLYGERVGKAASSAADEPAA